MTKKASYAATLSKQFLHTPATTILHKNLLTIERVALVTPAPICQSPVPPKLPPILPHPNSPFSPFLSDSLIIKNDAMAIIANQYPIPPILDSIRKQLAKRPPTPRFVPTPPPPPIPPFSSFRSPVIRFISPRYFAPSSIVPAKLARSKYATASLIEINSEPLSLSKHIGQQPKIYFTIQVGAFQWQIKTDHRFFHKINQQQVIKTDIAPNGFYRYMSGYFTNYADAERYRQCLKKLGYKDAFVAAYDRFNTRIEWDIKRILKEFGLLETTLGID